MNINGYQAGMNNNPMLIHAQNLMLNRNTEILPRLILLEQSPPVKESEESDELDYTKKRVHVVVKNVPFNIKLGLKQDQNSTQINLNHLMFEGKLLYDTDEAEDKEVDYVSVNPIELRRFVNQEGSEVKLQLRIKVLSSHHENLLFRVRIQAVNPNSNKEYYAQMTVLSDPIKVISKPERVKKSNSSNPKKKKNPDDQIREIIFNIEQQQNEQKILMENLLQAKNNIINNNNNNNNNNNTQKIFSLDQWVKSENQIPPSTPLSFSGGSNSTFNFSGNSINIINNNNNNNNTFSTASPFNTNNNHNNNLTSSFNNNNNSQNNVNNINNNNNNNNLNNHFNEITSQSLMFDSAFENFLIMYNTLNIDDRPAQIRKIIRGSSHKDLEHLSEFLQILSTEGVKENKESCSCAICPYQYKLFQMEKEPFLPDGDWDADLPLM